MTIVDADDIRKAAIREVSTAADSAAQRLEEIGITGPQGPLALLAAVYLIRCRAAGMSDAEGMAKIMRMASQTELYNPATKVH